MLGRWCLGRRQSREVVPLWETLVGLQQFAPARLVNPSLTSVELESLLRKRRLLTAFLAFAMSAIIHMYGQKMLRVVRRRTDGAKRLGAAQRVRTFRMSRAFGKMTFAWRTQPPMTRVAQHFEQWLMELSLSPFDYRERCQEEHMQVLNN